MTRTLIDNAIVVEVARWTRIIREANILPRNRG